ncbi:MAG TPA: c-type cytochrome [Candidatus Angelobacter sp.]|nr:c-type cytochrome [Candidatus Angelobacter sp.]
MKWRCGVLAFSIYTGASLCGSARAQQPPPPSAHLVQAQAPATRQPPPANAFAKPPQPALDTLLSFDAMEKSVTVSNGTPAAHFAFTLTNISSSDVTIQYVQTSCGCTVAKLPSTPWKLAPKEGGEISATMQLAGTPPGGTKIKTLTVHTDKGLKALYVKATVAAAPPAAMTGMDRTNAQKIALADRQAVFKGDCFRCHGATAKDPFGRDKMGQSLYAAVCGVCHDAEHRASFVPDLHHLPVPTSAEFWKNWIAHGKPGTLMPAFAKQEGGVLTDEQIASLAQFLSATIPSHPVTMPAVPGTVSAH